MLSSSGNQSQGMAPVRSFKLSVLVTSDSDGIDCKQRQCLPQIPNLLWGTRNNNGQSRLLNLLQEQGVYHVAYE